MLFLSLIILVCASLDVTYGVANAPVLTFLTAAASIIPMAEYIRRATDQIAKLAGPAMGGLLNVTIGNTAELILAIFVLRTGARDVVKGQIAGSIVGNGLLALGLAIVVGTWGKEQVMFHRQRAALLASLLILTMIALLVPALFDYTERHLLSNPNATQLAERLSLCVSIVLIFLYVANLFYTFITHRDVFVIATEASHADWSWARSISVLTIATIGIAVESHFVAQALGKTAETLGVTSLFLGRRRIGDHRKCGRLCGSNVFRAPQSDGLGGQHNDWIIDPNRIGCRTTAGHYFVPDGDSDESCVCQST